MRQHKRRSCARHAADGVGDAENPVEHFVGDRAAGGPSPAMRPRSSTITRWANSVAILRSCRIAITADAARRAFPGGRRHVELMAQIEARGRLVEQQQAGTMGLLPARELHHHARKMRPALLAAGQGGDDAVAEG